MQVTKRHSWAVTALLLALLAGCEARSVSSETSNATSAQNGSNTLGVPGSVDFIQGYGRGYQHAQAAGKPMLVLFTADWCDYCHQMQHEAFIDRQVVQLAQRFVCVMVDADQEPDVCQKFGVRGYPTVQFISPRGVPLNRLTGKTSGAMLTRQMMAALQAVASRVNLERAKRR